MSYDDFRKHYTDFEICNICMEQLYEDEAGQGVKVRKFFFDTDLLCVTRKIITT